MLRKAANFYKIQGNQHKAVEGLKRLAEQLISGGHKEAAIEVYSTIFAEIFEGDNYVYYPESVTDFI
jgi:hypothetical protein